MPNPVTPRPLYNSRLKPVYKNGILVHVEGLEELRDPIRQIVRYLREEAGLPDEAIQSICEAQMILQGPRWAEAYLVELFITRPVNPALLPWERRERQKVQAALKKTP